MIGISIIKNYLLRVLRLSFLVLLSACAGKATRQDVAPTADTKVDKQQSEKFVIGMVPLRVDQASRSKCPITIPGKLNWPHLAALANACVKAENWSKVEEIARELSRREYHSPWGPYYLSLVAFAREDLARSQWLIELAAKKAPQSGLFEYQKARLSLAQKNLRLAAEQFERSLVLDRRIWQANFYLGQLDYRDGNYLSAAGHFRKVLAVEPDNDVALQSLAESQLALGDVPASLELYAQLQGLYPSRGEYSLRRAFIFEAHAHDPVKALQTLRAVQFAIETRRITQVDRAPLNKKIAELKAAVDKMQTSTVRSPASLDSVSSTAAKSGKEESKK